LPYIFSYNSKIHVIEMKRRLCEQIVLSSYLVCLSMRVNSLGGPFGHLEVVLSGSYKDIILIKDS